MTLFRGYTFVAISSALSRDGGCRYLHEKRVSAVVLGERKPPGACPKYNSYCKYEHIFGGLMLASAWTALYSPFQRSLTVAENTQRHLTWLGHVAQLLEIASVLSLECKAAPSFMHVSQANNGYCYSAVVKS